MSIATIPESKPYANPVLNGRDEVGPIPDEKFYEIVNGERVEVPPMSFFAILIASRLSTAISNYAQAHRLGTAVMEAMFILDADAKMHRRPDVAFVSNQTWPLDLPFPKKGDLKVVPDLAVEVISPNDLAEEVFEKTSEYFHYGVKQVWMILPTLDMVYIYDSPTSGRILTAEQELAETVIPGFRLQLHELFQ